MINLYPVNFESITEKSGEIEYVYAGTQREISKILHGSPELDGYEFELVTDTNKSYYQLENNRPKENILKLCDVIEQDNKYFLNIQVTGQTIYQVVATFRVIKSGYIIDEFTYEFVVELNMQFIVNGETFSQGNTSSVGVTNYHLTSAKDVSPLTETKGDGLFPINIDLEMSNQLTGELEIDSNDNTKHYDVLNYALYWRHSGVMTESNMIQIVCEEENSDYYKFTYVEERGYQIIFKKDFNGTIRLELFFDAKGLGKYTYEWIIYVHGIAEISKDANFEETVRMLTANDDPFKSLENVMAITQTELDDSTVLKFTQNGMFSESQLLGSEDEYKVKYKYSYRILNSDIPASVTNEELFTNTDYKEISSKNGNDGEDAITKLPAVPLTMTDKKYYVVYKLEVSYLNPAKDPDEEQNEEQNEVTNVFEYYFTYVVINKGKIDIHNITADGKQSGEVDVDKGLTIANDNNKYLELFSYKHYLNVEDDVQDQYKHYELIYTGTGIKLTVGSYKDSSGAQQTYVASPTQEQDYSVSDEYLVNPTTISGKIVYQCKKSENDPVEYSLDIDNDKIELSKITGGSKTLIGYMKTENMYATSDNKVHSMFNSTFDNILAYQEFVKTFMDEQVDDDEDTLVTGIKFKDSENNEEILDLVNIPGTCRFGINLSEIFKEGSRFRNEYIADLIFVQERAEIYTVPAYQNSVKTAGFKLTTENRISPNTSYKLSQIFPLESYYSENSDITKAQQYQVIGASGNLTTRTSVDDWFSNSGVTIKDVDKDDYIVKIKIPMDTTKPEKQFVEYEIYKFTAQVEGSNGDGSDLYIIEADWFYINADKVIVPAYTSASASTTSFRFTNTDLIDKGQDATLNIGKGFSVWTIESTKGFVRRNASQSDITVNVSRNSDTTNSLRNEAPGSVDETNWSNNLYMNGKELTISAEALKKYKENKPDEIWYTETLYITISYNDEGANLICRTFECKIEFGLSDNI